MLFLYMLINLLRSTTLAILLFVPQLFSQKTDQHTFIVNTDHGFIDYANRIIVCRGTSEIEEKTPVDNSLKLVAKNLKIAKAEARTIARSNLIELMKQVNFDGRLVGELMDDEPLIESRLEGLIGSAYQQGEIEYLEGDKVAIALAVRMSGLSEILTDIEGYKSDNMNPAYLMTSAAIPKSQRISGIVIDAREHAVDPSMSPEVIDMQGNLVYGTISYSRSKAVNRGPVGYAYSMDDRNVSQRVGSNPLFIEAVGSLDDDIYITSMDANKVRTAEKSFGVLSNCRVMLLLQ
ncbi:hypothetical protein OAQ12_00330 [Candidatus Marinimicrobia bacterium]|jgi:hypothetical protein|nr:hypothetical protein [Candidatus Neomarinimicrobiota bacterium]MDG1847156.1 hypothetical protein [Candidatus Neomarinimicrobiota bacterium]|tara:strand:- start:3674 stop:4546 length:873 start_codon:yes stop_codon:yes gene_type:complete